MTDYTKITEGSKDIMRKMKNEDDFTRWSKEPSFFSVSVGRQEIINSDELHKLRAKAKAFDRINSDIDGILLSTSTETADHDEGLMYAKKAMNAYFNNAIEASD